MMKAKVASADAPRADEKWSVFPPRRDYASLSVRDLLDAREAYHVHLAMRENVVATAIGRYRIHKDDWYAENSPDKPRPLEVPLIKEARTLQNSVVRAWSWPCVLVFVRDWQPREALGAQAVPRSLFLPDGRVIPTCVVLATPDEAPPPPVPGPSQTSGMIGGGYACVRNHQGTQHIGTFACLVARGGSYYALTNHHVAGGDGERVRTYVHGELHDVGVSTAVSVTRAPFAQVFPGWPKSRTLLTLDAGLVRVDDVSDWTSQAFGIGEIGPAFDATETSITLDLIGCPLRAFGGVSGVMEGEIQALFFRYETLGGDEHVTDVLIGPRKDSAAPFTQPGDSGTLWFYDPPSKAPVKPHPDVGGHALPERGARARRLRPVAMQWGGERVRLPGGAQSAFALGSFLSSVCRALEVEIVREWSIGHDEYWGKIGHFSIGWKACDRVTGKLATLMRANQARVGFPDATISQGAEFRVGRQGFVPLADVPDYVWITSRRSTEPVQHFADIDIQDIHGGPSLLERGNQDPNSVSARAWKAYFDGFKAQGVGPEEGCLPFRVWQLWDEMVRHLNAGDLIRFVAAAGVLAHYVGDASQPMHCSYLHHGVPPMVKFQGRDYPVPRDSQAFKDFKETREAQIHGIYEEQMLEVDTADALARVDGELGGWNADGRNIRSGHDAAVEILRLMQAAQDRLTPMDIIEADDPSLGPKKRAARLWHNAKVRDATITSLAESVQLLADLWTSAWERGGGPQVPNAKLVAFEEGDLDAIYRRDHEFAPSWSLARMAKSGRFEPPG